MNPASLQENYLNRRHLKKVEKKCYSQYGANYFYTLISAIQQFKNPYLNYYGGF